MQRVWYIAYGSNLSLERFRCYVEGGRPAGGTRAYRGCRDVSEPQRVVQVDLPGRLAFAGRSRVWSGGMAFYDVASAGIVRCRGYLITVEQFADVVAQEMRSPPGGDFADAVAESVGRVDALHVLGTGSYETVHRLGSLDGDPMMTVTNEDVSALTLAAPAPAYLWWVGTGLRDAHRWTDVETTAYLLDAPGVQGAWESDDVLALLRATEPPAALG